MKQTQITFQPLSESKESIHNNGYIEILSSNFCKIIHREDLPSHLKFSKNGTGDRWCNKKYRYTLIYANGTTKSYHTHQCDIVTDNMLNTFILENRGGKYRGRVIIGIFVHGINERDKNNHPIKSSIRNKITKENCIVCNSNMNIECDHKNDFYNDERVLSLNTQNINDFQPLCRQCNLRKRGICQIEHKNKKIFSAKKLNEFKYDTFVFPWEKKIYDTKDKDCKEHTFWYDPDEFRRKVSIRKLSQSFLDSINDIILCKKKWNMI